MSRKLDCDAPIYCIVYSLKVLKCESRASPPSHDDPASPASRFPPNRNKIPARGESFPALSPRSRRAHERRHETRDEGGLEKSQRARAVTPRAGLRRRSGRSRGAREFGGFPMLRHSGRRTTTSNSPTPTPPASVSDRSAELKRLIKCNRHHLNTSVTLV